MSAFGTKRTWQPCSAMSAFGGKADIGLRCFDVGHRVGIAGYFESRPRVLFSPLQLSLALQHQSGLVSCPFGRYVAFLIRTNKQLRRKFDFCRARSAAFVLSNRDGLLRLSIERGEGQMYSTERVPLYDEY